MGHNRKKARYYSLHIHNNGVDAELYTEPIKTIEYGVYRSPFGICTIGTIGHDICVLSFSKHTTATRTELFYNFAPHATLIRNDQKIHTIGRTLFLDDTTRVHSLVVCGTPFQVAVWRALCGIQRGTTTHYKYIASRIKKPHAYRAVGSACGKNRIGYLIPCHRVCASDGSLGGFGWGLPLKKRMLAWEHSHIKVR